jgi:hypothetical protein
VVREFLQNLNVPIDDRSIEPGSDPPDVIYRNARFEVKELLDPDRRRHDEYRSALEKAKRAEEVTDLLNLTAYRPKDLSVAEIYEQCTSRIREPAKKYPPDFRASLDLLFYVNLQDVGIMIIEKPYPDTSELIQLGWRSVSFLKGYASCCFYAALTAPDFLQEKVGAISRRAP